MTSLGDQLDALTAAPVPAAAPRRTPTAPRGWEPGVAYDSSGGMTVTTSSTHVVAHGDEATWHALVAELGIAVPDGWRIRLVEAKYDPVAWTRDTPEQDKAVTKPVWRYRFAVERCLAGLNIDELVARVKRAKPTPRPAAVGELAFLFAMGDTQIGKVDGDGAEGTVDRVLRSIEQQKARLKELRRLKRPLGGDVYLPWLGDCLEGFNSQGGQNAWRTTMTLTEQMRVVRRLMLHQVQEFAPLCDRLIMPVVPGNHDEAVRFGKGITRYDDSWAIEAGVQVADALALSPTTYGHVSIVVPGKDERTLTLDVAGTLTGFVHGDQFRPGKAHAWWAEQAHGMQPIGDAVLLFGAHEHNFHVSQPGAKTYFRVAAMESESTWWRHLHGAVAPPSSLSLLVGRGGWSDLALI